MTGWLIVNSFLYTEKFKGIYFLLIDAAKKRDIDLKEMMWHDVYASAKKPDFALFWDKDVFLAQKIEAMGVRVFNDPNAVKICDSKAESALAFEKNNIPTPKTLIAPKAFPATGYSTDDFLVYAAESLGFPLVIKESYGSFGQQVYLAEDIAEAKNIIANIGAKEFIMQEFISESRGRDIRVNVVGGKVVSAIKRENKADFRSNITNGGAAAAYEPTAEQKSLAIAAAKAAGCDFAGVDIFDSVTPMVCEINASPHFKSSFDINGVDIAALIIDHVLKSI